jgi:hypothetical protein
MAFITTMPMHTEYLRYYMDRRRYYMDHRRDSSTPPEETPEKTPRGGAWRSFKRFWVDNHKIRCHALRRSASS